MDRKVDEQHRPEYDMPAAPPKFMRTVQGWIIGIGGILAAVLALKTTVVPLFSSHDSPPTERTQSAAKPVESDVLPSSSTTMTATAKKLLPTSYKIPKGTLSFDGSKWIEVNDTSIKNFKEMSRDSDGKTLLFDEDNRAYIRFPNEGGKAEYTLEDPIEWTFLYDAVAVDPH